jgi:hypothetical protein
LVDRIHDCRIRSWSDVDFGVIAGDYYDTDLTSVEEESKVEKREVSEEIAFEDGTEEELDLDSLTDEELQAILDADKDESAPGEENEDVGLDGAKLSRQKLSKRDLISDQAQYFDIQASSSSADRHSRSAPPPSLESCISQVSSLVGGSKEWVQLSVNEIGVSGSLGIKKGISRTEEVGKDRWEKSRRIERCMRK